MPDIQIPAETVEQFAMFMQRRDAIEQGGIIDGVARPTWEELGEGGQEAYMRDAMAYVSALLRLGLRPVEPPDAWEYGWFCEWADGSGTSQLLMGAETWGPRGRVFRARRRPSAPAGPWEAIE